MNQTVLTHGQEREQRLLTSEHRGFNAVNGTWNGKGTHMWRLKQEKPELFEEADKAAVQYFEERKSSIGDRPPGFEPCSSEGWLYNKASKVYYEKATRQRFWFDEAEQRTRPLHEGEVCPVALTGGAAATGGSASSSASAGGKAGDGASASSAAARQAAPKHVIISDIHAAAKALKMDFGHLDHPAGALAVIGAASAGSTATPDAVARALPEKLLRRLATFRGEWSDEMLSAAVQDTLVEVAASFGGTQLNAAVALVVGRRAVAVAAAPSTQVFAATRRGDEEAVSSTASATPALGQSCASLQRSLGEDPAEALLFALAAGAPGMQAPGAFEALSPHLSQGRPRAATIAQLRALRRQAADGPAVVAAARLAHRGELLSGSSLAEVVPASASAAGAAAGGTAAPSGGSAAAAPAAKRLKTEEPSGKQVRVRQVLLRHTSCAATVPSKDPVRGRPVRRSLEEAEEQMLSVLDDLLADKGAGFPAVCKAVSECQSALKGGDFAGDLGWLDRRSSDNKQQGSKDKALRVQLPSSVLKAAFELSVGELSDILASDQGVHLLQRTA